MTAYPAADRSRRRLTREVGKQDKSIQQPVEYGKLSTARYSSLYLALDEEKESVKYPEGSERNDLEQVKKILIHMNVDQQQSKIITDSCRMQAQEILSDYSIAVDKVAAALVKRGSLTGRAAHSLIWRTVGYPEHDWRFVALGIRQ